MVPRDDLAAAVDSADVLIWCTDDDAERSALLADPVVADLRATAMGRTIFTPVNWPLRSPTRRRCPIRWWPNSCHPSWQGPWADGRAWIDTVIAQ